MDALINVRSRTGDRNQPTCFCLHARTVYVGRVSLLPAIHDQIKGKEEKKEEKHNLRRGRSEARVGAALKRRGRAYHRRGEAPLSA